MSVTDRRIGPNQMAFDLGYDPAMAAEPRLVEAMLREVDQLFDLVMIMELMDESLVLLRRLMCWSTDDVVSLPKQERVHSRRTALSDEQRAALEEYLTLDVALYRHFRRRMADRVAAVPLETFLSQAETLVQRRRFWHQKCVLNTVNGFDLEGDQREFTDKVHGYQLRDANDWMCSRLGMAEVGYTDFLRGTQRQRLAVRDHVSELLRIADVTQTPANQR
ncbi:Galactose-3-O-sulfotransferase 3 [Amphibalanus amphitrite]|uniref:Galactose-3-O-sulfotransferase 3 n=1 Tax=Amphibalanus amphitrite TaxID=1232801 RepID=A0A6A4WIY6_AMPAM|nr:Galactose-3-O-sulfotransferase 3 [Amphibalanus amphitrite]